MIIVKTAYRIPKHFFKFFDLLTVSAQPLTGAQADLFVVLAAVAKVLALRVALAGCIGIKFWLNTMYHIKLTNEKRETLLLPSHTPTHESRSVLWMIPEIC